MKGAKLDLKYFIFRTNSILMYRETLKLISNIKDRSSIEEMKAFIRYEFEQNKHITDSKKLEFLQATGRQRINSLRETMDMSK